MDPIQGQRVSNVAPVLGLGGLRGHVTAWLAVASRADPVRACTTSQTGVSRVGRHRPSEAPGSQRLRSARTLKPKVDGPGCWQEVAAARSYLPDRSSFALRLLPDPTGKAAQAARDPGGQVRSMTYFLASNIRLNGVSVARRNRVKPPSANTRASRASPAWAPSARPTSCESEFGVQTMVDAA